MIGSPILSLIFLLGASLITGMASVMQRVGKMQTETLAKGLRGPVRFLFSVKNRDLLGYSLTMVKSILLIAFTITAFSYVLHHQDTEQKRIIASIIILGIAILSDTLFRALSLFRPHTFFKITCHASSFFLLLFWPLSALFFSLLKRLFPEAQDTAPFRIKDKILEVLNDTEFAPFLDLNDQKLILSMVSFKKRIVREIMVPRIDMFTLDAETSVKVAAKHFLEEGYSRIPVYKENMDNIVGTLYYKDLLNVYFTQTSSPDKLNHPIEKLLKPIMYTPETKRISHLLQEFRLKQIHLAIVVDEYGGTEGIVTIEDILEELVGEIADEYDYGEEALYSELPGGGWIVDAKMTIIDVEEELGIKIPESPEYETIGGYIFHKAGSIPSKGWLLHQNELDIEVLSSSERAIEKIRITPHK